MSYYRSEYNVISTNTPKYEEYYTPNQIPTPMYLGSRGEECKTNINCHQNLSCINKKCDDWIPQELRNTPPQKENFKSLSTIKSTRPEFFKSVAESNYLQMSADPDFPINNKVSKDVQYTSKQKENSGKNYWK
jgi:hypothetical protein